MFPAHCLAAPTLTALAVAFHFQAAQRAVGWQIEFFSA
jgi:hypothetical protein